METIKSTTKPHHAQLKSHQKITHHSENSAVIHRLPCRGCTVSCDHLDSCGGAPWRKKTP